MLLIKTVFPHLQWRELSETANCGLLAAILLPYNIVDQLSGAGSIYSSVVVSPERLMMRHYCNNASLVSITCTKLWTHTCKITLLHARTSLRCFKSPWRIGCDYCGYRDCYHRLPSRPLSVEHFPVRSFQLRALFTLMWAGGNIAERRLP